MAPRGQRHREENGPVSPPGHPICAALPNAAIALRAVGCAGQALSQTTRFAKSSVASALLSSAVEKADQRKP
jgi:hypothetical protein